MDNLWLKLDNAAKVYPLVESEYITTVYRMSMTLTIEIQKDRLLQTLIQVMKRFPYYKVTLKKGFFWYYLEENHNDLFVFEDLQTPCRRMVKEETNGYLFRVLYKDSKISVEFNHMLGDGTGCMTFLSTLVYEYLSQSSIPVTLNDWVKDISSEVDQQEYEDSHSVIGNKYQKTHQKKIPIEKNVFHLKSRSLSHKKFLITKGLINEYDLTLLSKKLNCSITVLLVSIYLECMIEIQKEQIKQPLKHKTVGIQVPVNMRKRISSKSMRNFSLYMIPVLSPLKEWTLETIIESVKDSFQTQSDLDYLLRLMVTNFKTERAVKFLPLRFKMLITPFIYQAVGMNTISGTISNIGRIQLSEDMQKYIQRIEFILGPCPTTKNSCAVTGFNGQIILCFGRTTHTPWVETKFFRKLVQLGIKVHIETEGDE